MAEVVVSPRAQAELREIANWYEVNAPAAKHSIEQEFNQIMKLTTLFPMLHAVQFDTYRRAALRNFPYAIWYEFDAAADRIDVVLIRHQRSLPLSPGDIVR